MSEFWNWKSTVKLPVEFISCEASLHGLQIAALLLPLHIVIFSTCEPLRSLCGLISSPHMHTTSDWTRAHPRSSFNFITSLKPYLMRCWGLEPHPMNLVGGHNSTRDIYSTFFFFNQTFGLIFNICYHNFYIYSSFLFFLILMFVVFCSCSRNHYLLVSLGIYLVF